MLILWVQSLSSSPLKELYNPKTFFTHAALLGQSCLHCPIFPTAASRRSLDRLSVPMWPITLSGRLPIVGLVGRYLTNYLIGRELIHIRYNLLLQRDASSWSYAVLAVISDCYSPDMGRLFTRYSPVRHSLNPEGLSSFDLHVLSMPPAFILSQNQTLKFNCLKSLLGSKQQRL